MRSSWRTASIAHELTHDCLAHLALPLWLNEGVAVVVQKAIAPPPRPTGQSTQDALFGAAIGWSPPVLWDELAERFGVRARKRLPRVGRPRDGA